MTASTDQRHRSTARELQQSATAVLARLLTADLPAVTWHITRFAADPTFPVLIGQADSYAAVCSWAAHLRAEVELAHGDTPTARTVVDGIGVRVWCAPAYRDDLDPGDQDGRAAA